MTGGSGCERPLIALVLALLCLYLALDFASPSMALDGVIYAGIANLAAAGMGSFWYPPYFDVAMPAFHDHPPLGLWLLSQWFRLLGDAFWVERAFNGLVTVLVAGGIIYLWSRIEKQLAWWPLALFFLMPVTTYALKNNSLEGLLTLMTLLGVMAAWAGRHKPLLNVLVGLASLCAVMIKGPVGLFPLIAPACFALILLGDLRRALINSIIAGVTLLLGFALLLAFEPARISLLNYLDGQLLASLSGARTIEHGRAYLIGQLLLNVASGSALVVLVGLLRRRFKIPREFWAYFAIALAASLPLLISPRHYRYYLLPSLPYYAICLGLIVQPQVKRLRRDYVWVVAAVIFTVAALRFYWHFGMPGVDANELNDAALIARVAEAETLGYCAANLQRRAYLTRYYGLRSSWIRADEALGYYVCESDFSDERFIRVTTLSENLTLWRYHTLSGD